MGSAAEFEGEGAAAWSDEVVDESGDGESATSCGVTRFGNGTRTYGPGGAAGFLKIGFGRGRVGDGDADGLGLLAASAAAAFGEDGEGGR